MKWVASAAVRVVLLSLIWTALSHGNLDYAPYGAISVIGAAALSLGLLPPGGSRVQNWPHRIWHALMLIGWFLWKSTVGGVDVAVRAIRPGPAIEPAVVPAPLRLPAGHARETALLLMNLMPGSMVQREVTRFGGTADAADSEAVGVELHTLSLDLEPAAQWDELQRRVGAAYGVELQVSGRRAA